MFTIKNLFKTIVFLAVIVIFTGSCKDDVIIPDYVGTWKTFYEMPNTSGFILVEHILTLSDGSFHEKFKDYAYNSYQTADVTMSGSISVSEDHLNFTIKALRFIDFHSITGLPTGVIRNYNAMDPNFESLIPMGQPKSFISVLNDTGNEMTVKIDRNEDGDYLDQLETTVYTKQ